VTTSIERDRSVEKGRDILTSMVSVDDHVVEPPTLWTDRLGRVDQERAPRVERLRTGDAVKESLLGVYKTLDLEEHADGWIDLWRYEDLRFPMLRSYAAAGLVGAVEVTPITYDDIRPGCYEPEQRLADMTEDGIDVSLCFPNIFVRFCGQRFLEAQDKALALRCVRAYNDWLTQGWAAPSGGRLLGAYIIPLWDAQLAAQEVERIAGDARAVCFSEMPTRLGLPSIYSGGWDPFFAACEANDILVAMHIGSSSTQPTSSDDAPPLLKLTNNYTVSSLSLSDWLLSGVLDRFPGLRIAFAEAQAGWIPYLVDRLDRGWHRNDPYLFNEHVSRTPHPPSTYLADHVFVCVFDDPIAMAHLDVIGEDNICFETDYPHPDGSWPNSGLVAERQTKDLSPELREKVLRLNGLRMLGVSS
jgi:predicted TIM-barrel fold metal-dependent hydrolase